MSTSEEQSSNNQMQPPKFFAGLPDEVLANLSDNWRVDAELAGPKQITRIINKIEDFLAGITPDGTDKAELKAEAGRILSHMIQSLADDEFIQDATSDQRAFLKSEAARLWNEGGQDANELWKARLRKAEQPATIEAQTSGSDVFLSHLLQAASNLHTIQDVAIRSIDNVIAFVKRNHSEDSVAGLELSRKIIDRFDTKDAKAQIITQMRQTREAIAEIDAGSYLKAEEEKIALSGARDELTRALSTFLQTIGGLYRLAENSQNEHTANAIRAAGADIEDALGLANVEKIVATEGKTIDFDSMEPTVEHVESRDEKHSGGETIARVVENGYRFGSTMHLYGGKDNDNIQRARVEVFKYEK